MRFSRAAQAALRAAAVRAAPVARRAANGGVALTVGSVALGSSPAGCAGWWPWGSGSVDYQAVYNDVSAARRGAALRRRRAGGAGAHSFSAARPSCAPRLTRPSAPSSRPRAHRPTPRPRPQVAALLDELNYDDGSYGPVFVRLAWHAAGTYNKADGSGGSNGATMRHAAEAGHGANAGLKVARDRLEKVKAKYPGLSYADLWSIAGVCAIQEMGGPTVAWRAGRSDLPADKCTPDGRLPDASKGQDHLRAVFGRMGFNDEEIVALSGAHALGRCHTDRSGFKGPWTRAPTSFSNDYFQVLLSEKWVEKKWAGPKQFVDAKTGELMMLPTDLALLADPSFKKTVDLYAKDSARFAKDFAAAFQKLGELGVKFPEGTQTITFKRT